MLVGNQAKHVSEVWDWSEICGRSILEYLWKSAPLKDEVRKSSVEEMDPLDSASQEGEINRESDDDVIAESLDGLLVSKPL